MQKFWLATLLVASMANGIENNPPYPVAEAPQLPLEVYSEDFAKILGTRPKLIHLARGFGFTEGPVYLAVKDTEEGYLLFTDQINDNILIMRWHGIQPYNQIRPLLEPPVIFRHPSIADDKP
jgi:gluconolactonase